MSVPNNERQHQLVAFRHDGSPGYRQNGSKMPMRRRDFGGVCMSWSEQYVFKPARGELVGKYAPCRDLLRPCAVCHLGRDFPGNIRGRDDPTSRSHTHKTSHWQRKTDRNLRAAAAVYRAAMLYALGSMVCAYPPLEIPRKCTRVDGLWPLGFNPGRHRSASLGMGTHTFALWGRCHRVFLFFSFYRQSGNG